MIDNTQIRLGLVAGGDIVPTRLGGDIIFGVVVIGLHQISMLHQSIIALVSAGRPIRAV